jgi:superfamily I DNA and/or RNA helicase
MPSGPVKIILEEMLLAISANIDYLRSEGNDTLRVKNGQLVSNLGELYIYKFELEFFQDIESDAEIEIRINNQSTSGKVIAVEEKSIHIQTERNLGTVIAEAKLVITSYYLLELLHKKLEEVSNGEGSLTNLNEKTFGLIPSITERKDSLNFEEKSSFDKYKQEAMKLIIGSEVSFIWGPPGTGKTQLIASVIKRFLNEGLSTLLISHTNIATDGALERSMVELVDSAEYQEGKILRIGKIQKEGLKKFELVTIEKVLELRQLPLKKEIERISNILNLLAIQIENNEQYAVLNEKHTRLEKLLIEGNSELNSLRSDMDNHKNSHLSLKQELEKHESKINNFQSLNSFRRMFSGTNIQKLTSEKVGLLNTIQRKEALLNSLNSKTNTFEERLEQLNKEKNQIYKEIQKINIDTNSQIDLDQIKSEIKKLTEQKDALVKQVDQLSDSIVKDALLIATTLTKSYSDKLVLGRKYDCVILDEASMAPLPAVWYATGLANKKTVMVGDFFQLPPIAKYRALKDKSKTEQEYEKEEKLVDKWLKKDIFWAVGIFSEIKNNRIPKWLEQLKLQYRMHPDIAELINHIMYKKYGVQFQLESAETTRDRGNILLAHQPLTNNHIGIYDTSKIGSIASRTDSGSYYNLYQALVVVELAKQAVANGYTEIGIICPFRAQINLIQKIVKDEKIEKNIVADTVHRFQGGEKQIIILDLTTPNPTKLTDDEQEEGDDEKIVNVAFSRAREKCIVVADLEKLMKKHSLSSPFRKFVTFCIDKKYPIISSDDILNGFSYSEKSEEWMSKISNADLSREMNNFDSFDQTDFYPNFYKDLISAEKEVIIESPFITSKRVAPFLPIFDYLIKKGVKIFIITRPSKEHKDNMRIESENELQTLEDMGVIVLPMYGHIHEKIAVIDRNILWAGSLNILSQNVSREIMWRFLGASASDQILTFLKIKKNIGEMGDNRLKRCEICKVVGSWYWTDKSRFGGTWTFCLTGVHKPGKEPTSEADKKAKRDELSKWRKVKKALTPDGTPICPQHELPMTKRKGHWGFLWGCSKWPRCRITEKYIEVDKNQQSLEL